VIPTVLMITSLAESASAMIDKMAAKLYIPASTRMLRRPWRTLLSARIFARASGR
jgi:hypothetical protein